MMTNVFDSLNEKNVYSGYRDTEGGKEVMDSLVTMAKNAGFRFNESLDLAKQVMDAVDTYDNIREQVQEDVQAAMNQIFSALDAFKPEARLDAMNQLLFGLNMVSDAALLEKLDAGTDPQMLFQESSNKYLASAPKAEEHLRESLLRKVSNLHLSPKALGRMGKAIAASSDYVATAAALGRKGYALKCVAAMDMYLKNRDTMDVEEAALTTCEAVDLEAVSDALRLGEISDNVATVLVFVAILALFIAAVSTPPNAAVIKPLLILLGGLTGLSFLSFDGKNVYHILGEKVALAAGYVKSGVETFQAGIDRICAYMEAEETPTVTVEEVNPLYDVQNVEEYI